MSEDFGNHIMSESEMMYTTIGGISFLCFCALLMVGFFIYMGKERKRAIKLEEEYLKSWEKRSKKHQSIIDERNINSMYGILNENYDIEL